MIQLAEIANNPDWRKFKPMPHHLADQAFQTCIRGAIPRGEKTELKLYFVQCYYCDWTKYSQFRNIDRTHGLQFEATFYRSREDSWRVTKCANDTDTLHGILAFFDEVYQKMGCVPDALNN